MPVISVIIPNYNNVKFLFDTLRSVLNQTFAGYEVIIVDDGSTDDSRMIIDEFVATDARFHAIYQANGGVSSARNAGLEVASGKYIFFMDSDDMIAPDALSGLLDCAVKHDADMVSALQLEVKEECSYSDIIPCSEAANTTVHSGSIPLNTERYMWIHNSLFSRQTIGDTRFALGLRIHEDLLFFLELYVKMKCVVDFDFIVSYYRCNENSVLVRANANPTIWVRSSGLFAESLHRLIAENDFSENVLQVFKKKVASQLSDRRFLRALVSADDNISGLARRVLKTGVDLFPNALKQVSSRKVHYGLTCITNDFVFIGNMFLRWKIK